MSLSWVQFNVQFSPVLSAHTLKLAGHRFWSESQPVIYQILLQHIQGPLSISIWIVQLIQIAFCWTNICKSAEICMLISILSILVLRTNRVQWSTGHVSHIITWFSQMKIPWKANCITECTLYMPKSHFLCDFLSWEIDSPSHDCDLRYFLI